jgi:WhiB family redox-sensing transcriptional regulator
MSRRERLPAIVKGCGHCRSLFVSARHARSEAIRTKRLLAKHAYGGLAERYRDEATKAKDLADDADARYFAHHAEAHPIPSVVLPGTDNDRAPSHRKPTMPPAADLAARLRAGETLGDLTVEYERTPAVISRKISMAGFNGHTGEPRTSRRDEDGLTVPMHEWSFPPWVDQALCAQVDPEIFFPDKGGSTREAKAVCRACPVRLQCLEYALANSERFGIYGGLAERERRKLKKEAS